MQGAGAAVTAALSFVLLAWLARVLGTAHFGAYVATLGAAVLLLILIEGGWPTLLYRETAGARQAPTADPLMGLALAHTLAVAFALAALALLLGSRSSIDLAAACGCMGLVATMNLISARLRGEGRFTLEALWQVGGRLVSATAIVAVVALAGANIAAIFLAWAAGLLLVLPFGAARLARPRWQGVRALYPIAGAFVLVEGCLVFLTKGDVALLGAIGAEPAGLSQFAACTRFNEAALLLFAPVSNVMLRSLRRTANTPATFTALLRPWLIGATALGAAAVAGSLLLGDMLVSAVFGPGYAAAADLLPWCAAMLPFALGNLLLAQAMIARDAQNALVRRLVLASVLMLLAIPVGFFAFGTRGAALAVAVSHAVLWACCLDRVFRRPPASP